MPTKEVVDRLRILALLSLLSFPAIAASKAETDLAAQVTSIQDDVKAIALDHQALVSAMNTLREIRAEHPTRDHAETIRKLNDTDDAIRRLLALQADVRQIVVNNLAWSKRRVDRAAVENARVALAERLQVIQACAAAVQLIFIVLLFLGTRRRM